MARTNQRAGRPPSPEVHYRAVVLPGGGMLPIEARVGRRLLRTIPVDSEEAKALLAGGSVEILRADPGRPETEH